MRFRTRLRRPRDQLLGDRLLPRLPEGNRDDLVPRLKGVVDEDDGDGLGGGIVPHRRNGDVGGADLPPVRFHLGRQFDGPQGHLGDRILPLLQAEKEVAHPIGTGDGAAPDGAVRVLDDQVGSHPTLLNIAIVHGDSPLA